MVKAIEVDVITGNIIEVDIEVIPQTLEGAKEAKRAQIRREFIISTDLPVLVSTVNYPGGFDSAIKLDAAKRLVEASGGTSVVFFDVTNLPHTLTLVEAQGVITAIGADYQTKFALKQSKMVAVANATTVTQVEVVI